jgi:hypothetical protein
MERKKETEVKSETMHLYLSLIPRLWMYPLTR